MRSLWKAWLVWILWLLACSVTAQDILQAQLTEIIASGRSDGLEALIGKLDSFARSAPGTPEAADALEAIQTIGFLHPGVVPDRSARLKTLQNQAQPSTAYQKFIKRTTILEQYYDASSRGDLKYAASLSDPAFEDSLFGIPAAADAAFRKGDYESAGAFATQFIEANPFSALLASSYTLLGLCDAYQGKTQSAVFQFQRALAASPLPTLYGRTQNYLFTAYRFARPVPAPLANLYDEEVVIPISGAQIKEPRSLITKDDTILILDKDQILTLSSEGKILETKTVRAIEDMVHVGSGKFFYLSEDGIDFSAGVLTKLTYVAAAKTKTLGNLQSLVVDAAGDIFVLDRDIGLLRATPKAGATLAMSPVAPSKGKLLRMDRMGNFYVLSQDQRSILIYSHQGKPITTIIPAPTNGKAANIESFSFDDLNNLYILDEFSIQIFGMYLNPAGIAKTPISTISFDLRPAHKNLRTITLSADGKIWLLGKNEGNWVIFR